MRTKRAFADGASVAALPIGFDSPSPRRPDHYSVNSEGITVVRTINFIEHRTYRLKHQECHSDLEAGSRGFGGTPVPYATEQEPDDTILTRGSIEHPVAIERLSQPPPEHFGRPGCTKTSGGNTSAGSRCAYPRE